MAGQGAGDPPSKEQPVPQHVSNFGSMGLGIALQRVQNPMMASGSADLPGWQGGGGGMMLGAFLAPFDSVGGLKVAENATAKETAVATLRQTATKAGGMGRTFAVIGAVYAGSECVIEKYRAKSDLMNSAYAGCLTGGILARGAGPIGIFGGCAGFAAWSTAIDSFMHSSAGEGVMK